MGTIQIADVLRLRDGVKIECHAWTREDGSYEAFWHEDGTRLTFFFDADGEQQIAWMKQYKLILK